MLVGKPEQKRPTREEKIKIYRHNGGLGLNNRRIGVLSQAKARDVFPPRRPGFDPKVRSCGICRQKGTNLRGS
jgi:hypothetical protein